MPSNPWVRAAVAWALLCAAGAAAAAAKEADAPLPDLDKAKWIWDVKGALKGAGAAPMVFFRKTFELTEEPSSAVVLITADNGYQLYVNGTSLGGDLGYDAAYWRSIERYDVANVLVKGRNVLAVHATMLGGSAGLIAALRVECPLDLPVEVRTDATWRMSRKAVKDWNRPEFSDAAWAPAVELGPMGAAPWGPLKYGQTPTPVPGKGPAPRRTPVQEFVEPPEGFRRPEAVAFVADDCSLYGNGRTLFRIGRSRAWTQNDIPGPSLLGRRLMILRPAGPDAEPRVLHDAGTGVIGSPSASYDGKWVYFSMAPAGEKFFHVYRVAAAGGTPQRLTAGCFHDADPHELPDGRIAFSSTRMGTYEEYHSGPARGLFVMEPDGSAIRCITHTIVFDTEPRPMADGRIAFVRADNFFERAKVETQIHAIRPDGTAGQVEFGADRGRVGYDRANAGGDFGGLLRNYGYGSCAPLPDGRLACLSTHGLLISYPGVRQPTRVPNLDARRLCDIAPLPDGRLLCTTANQDAIGVLDPAAGSIVRLYAAPDTRIHSAVYVGQRPRPPALADHVGAKADAPDPTGFLLCQDVYNTRQTGADWPRIRAIRIYEGRALTQRSSHSDIVHIGVQAVEQGTVPVAPDGSFYVEVPADRALAIQAVDAEGRAVLNELSWIYVRPGERRSCAGCHVQRQVSPTEGRVPPLATRSRPIRLLGQGRPHRFRGNNAANGGGLNLQLDRFREVASIDLHTLGAVAGPGRAAEVQALIKTLAGPDEGLRISSARRLAIFRDRSAAPALAAALADRCTEVRLAAAIGLSACGDRRAIEPLLAALDDAEDLVAQAAHVALENLTAHAEPFDAFAPPARRGADRWRAYFKANTFPQIEQALIEALSGRDAVGRHMAAVALGHVGGDAARQGLRQAVRQGSLHGDLRASMEAIRALGYLRDADAVEALAAQFQFAKRANVAAYHRAAAAADALGRIATPAAQDALLAAYALLGDYWRYCGAYGDHSALHACHASPMHFRIAEALDAIGAAAAVAPVVPKLLRAVPIDTDRGLLLDNDAFETVTARVVGRSGLAEEVVRTCLAVLGDKGAAASADLRPAVTASGSAWAGRLDPETRAAQLLSVVCRDGKYAPAVRAAFDRYRAMAPAPRGTALGNPRSLPVRNWVCFFLARLLGVLRDAGSASSLIAALQDDLPEAAFGRPAPPGVPVLFLTDWPTPCPRAAAADALGRIGDRRATPALLAAVRNFDNAVDVRHAAAVALGRIADPAALDDIRKLAADYPEVSTRRALIAACAPPQNP